MATNGASNGTHDPTKSGLTLSFARFVTTLGDAAHPIPSPLLAIARQCLLDTLGCAVAAHRTGNEPEGSGLDNVALLAMLEAELLAQAEVYNPAVGLGAPLSAGASIWAGTTTGMKPLRLSPLDATLLNGTAAHTLDYDDVEMMGPTHTSVVLLPPLLALAETLSYPQNSIPAVIEAFVAGFEVTSRMGAIVSPDMYSGRGFHATGTVGAIGAAASCAKLLGLSVEQTAHALGLAGTQASGLKSLFGTHAKPFHAGKAGYHGLLSALLAKRGFESRLDALECKQGFVMSHSSNFNWEAIDGKAKDWHGDVGGGWHLRNNLFKYHASCYYTHAPIDAVRSALSSSPASPTKYIHLKIADFTANVCNIPTPTTGLEAKFSLRHALAAASLGRNTGKLATWTDGAVQADTAAAALVQSGVDIEFARDWDPTGNLSEVIVILEDGTELVGKADSGMPAKVVMSGEGVKGVETQADRIEKKFRGLVEDKLGAERAGKLVEMCYNGEGKVRELVGLTWL